MGSYKIVYRHTAEKDLCKIPAELLRRIIDRINALAENPFPAGAVLLKGGDRLYRIRIGEYRVVYEIVKEREEIVIHYVRHRRDVYRKMS